MMRPGRGCPLSYRYSPSDLAQAGTWRAETLYVIGGLYGNRAALKAVLARSGHERGDVRLVFNGDFNWFNVDVDDFLAVNDAVLQHMALRGNVETELAGNDSAAGCGCGYPEWVVDTEVERSNLIMERLLATAHAFPDLRARLGTLPMYAVAEVGDLHIAIVHGDTESLAGWGFSQEALRDESQRDKAAAWFNSSAARVFASSHTCLPVMQDFETPRGRCVLANNGAAGMPNFRTTRHGLITRISCTPAADALYGTALDGVHIEALPVYYDHASFERVFLANWPAGSPAYDSYYHRITAGPSYDAVSAVRLQGERSSTSACRRNRCAR
jgi:hypothetical protein